jgi:kinetochore protein Nuf2
MQARKQPPVESAGFPLMKTEELVECLAALGITVQMDDIIKPTAQTAQMIYAALLDALTGASMEHLEAPKAALLGMIEYKVRCFGLLCDSRRLTSSGII